MSNTTNWVEVADTAVKIGLSGTIAAIGGYVLAKRNQRSDIEKEYLRRRQDMIQNVSAQFASLHETIVTVCTNYFVIVSGEIQGSAVPPGILERYQKFFDDIGLAIGRLHRLEADLLLVGATNATHRLRSYREQVANLNDAIDNSRFSKTAEHIHAIMQALHDAREFFYGALHEAFKKV
jgi:hypothetical protein